MWPHRRQPTRRPHPWDSLGKNTGVGCHFLLQCMKVQNQSEVAQSCPTLRDPMDCSPPGSSVYGIFQARVLEWGAIAFSSKELIQGKRPWCWERLKVEDETAGWHHQLDGRESEWAPGVGDGQGSLLCCVHGAAKSQTQLSDWIFRFRKLESKAMQPKSKQKKEIIKVRNYWHWKQDIKRIKSTNLKLGSLKTSSKLVNL